MAGKADHANQTAAIARASEMVAHAPGLLAHLHTILESDEFKGSRRSQEFLRHIVGNALEGNFDRLKERTIGMELFSRDADYDTGEDSIVRVSASDVRKRLHHYYSKVGIDYEFQIDLPAGSYIPAFRLVKGGEDSPKAKELLSIGPVQVLLPEPVNEAAIARGSTGERRLWFPGWWTIASYTIAILSLALASYLLYQNRLLRQSAVETSSARILPWPALFEKGHRTNLVVSDTGYSSIQDLLGVTIPLADYARFRYPEDNRSPEAARVAKFLSQKQFTAVVDVGITTRISELAHAYGSRIQVRWARGLQVQDFKNDDNFILLGSARANPWTMLFDQQLDFSEEYDPALGKLVFHNRHPKAGEAEAYVPSAAFGQTGDSYATLAFIENPNQTGNVLMIAGTSAEGTEVAGRLVTNVGQFGQTLRKAGIDPTGPPRGFQLVLRLFAVAGSSSGFEVVAFHAGHKFSR